MDPRLCVPTNDRESESSGEHLGCKSREDVDRRRRSENVFIIWDLGSHGVVAWRELDICIMGHISRSGGACLPIDQLPNSLGARKCVRVDFSGCHAYDYDGW